MSNTDEVRHYAMRALIAWDGTVLPKAHDGMMQERMEDLRAALAQPAASGEPVAWWIPKAEQFALAKKDGSRPFAKAWEPLYATAQPAPARQPLTLEQINRIEMATEWPEGSLRNIGPRDWGRLLVCAVRAIEAAHGIGAPGAPDAQKGMQS